MENIQSHYLPKFNKFDKNATIKTFFIIFYPKSFKEQTIIDSLCVLVSPVTAFIFKDKLNRSRSNQDKTKRKRVKNLYKKFNRKRNSSNFFKHLNPLEYVKYMNYILRNF